MNGTDPMLLLLIAAVVNSMLGRTGRGVVSSVMLAVVSPLTSMALLHLFDGGDCAGRLVLLLLLNVYWFINLVSVLTEEDEEEDENY